MSKLMMTLRMTVVTLLLAFGAVSAAPVAAQVSTPEDEITTVDDEAEDTAGDVADETEDVADDVVTDDEDGFEWGLLGLLGLAGLAGLMRRPKPVVHEDLDRTRGTAVRRDDDRTTL